MINSIRANDEHPADFDPGTAPKMMEYVPLWAASSGPASGGT